MKGFDLAVLSVEVDILVVTATVTTMTQVNVNVAELILQIEGLEPQFAGMLAVD